MGTEKKRLSILDNLKVLFLKLHEENKTANKNSLVSELCLKYGVTSKKAIEYIQVLIDGKFIFKDKDELVFRDFASDEISLEEAEKLLNSEPIEEIIKTDDDPKTELPEMPVE